MSDVIVVGGGPVGITTAILLAQRDFEVTVLEKTTQVYDLPRAIVMDDEIQRVYQNAGLGAGLRAITSPMLGAEFVTPVGERIVGFELPPDAVSPLGHPPSVVYYQPELETFLRSAAVAAGVDLRLGVEVDSVDQTPEGVTVRTADGESTARWLVAADGASSPIRKALGLSFVDQGFDQDWLVLDVRLRRPVPSLSPLVQQICDPERPTTYVVGHGDYRRWEFQLQPGDRREEMTEPGRVWQLLQPWLTAEDAELVRAVVYRFHATVADDMRVGRIFLAGDAAHQMPPFLGQGLCSGIRDAANLAWKLRLVDDGAAPPSLLDTYAAERLPHAAGVVAHAVDTGRLIDELSGRSGDIPDLSAGYGGGRPFPRLEHGLLEGDHPAVGRQLPQPSIDGTPLDELLGSGFAVVADAEETVDGIQESWGSLATVLVVPEETLPSVLPSGGAVIVRPDRYVAAVCDDRAALVEAGDALVARVMATAS
jgi:3-(3-hydroxy-phenyl)propionate hydroxylase